VRTVLYHAIEIDQLMLSPSRNHWGMLQQLPTFPLSCQQFAVVAGGKETREHSPWVAPLCRGSILDSAFQKFTRQCVLVARVLKADI